MNTSGTNENSTAVAAEAAAAASSMDNGEGMTTVATSSLTVSASQLSHKLRMERYVSSSLSSSLTNANIVFETKIRIIDILQVWIYMYILLSSSMSFLTSISNSKKLENIHY